MAGPVELIPLICPKCATPIPAEADEVAWRCAQCGQGVTIDEEHGLAPVRIRFAGKWPPNTRGKPFWVVTGQVTLRRDTFSGDRDHEAFQFWSQPRQFYVPAFSCDFEAMLALGISLARSPRALDPSQPVDFDPVTLPLVDIRPVVEFIVMAIEAERSDKVKEVAFQVELEEPELWVLP